MVEYSQGGYVSAGDKIGEVGPPPPYFCNGFVISKRGLRRYREFLNKINEELDKPHDDVV